MYGDASTMDVASGDLRSMRPLLLHLHKREYLR
jgi:hypothetical protein